ncbi:MAG TPA: serine/threonine-protein kinase, partial [Pirellulales bacterium]
MTAPETIPPRDEPPENGPETVAHAQAPETAAPTRDYLETPGPSGATAEAKSGESGLRHAPRIPGYEILEELGRGGMGVVYKARQLGLKRLVALKMIRAHSCDSRALSRFRAEAAAAARLQHPNIVQVYEIGEQHEEPYFALEFVSGGALAQRLDRTPQPARASAALVETIARAVQAAHEKGIVHRDLKPANILLDQGSSEPPRTVSGSPAATAHPA